MSAVQYSPVVVFATGLSGWANCWTDVTPPARVYVPREIREAQRVQLEAEAEFETAHDLHIETYNDVTRDNLEDKRVAMQAAIDRVIELKAQYLAHPEDFDISGGEVV